MEQNRKDINNNAQNHQTNANGDNKQIDDDFEHFTLTQSLTTVLNDPRNGIPFSKDWSSSDAVIYHPEDIPVVQLHDFGPYLENLGRAYELFSANHKTDPNKKVAPAPQKWLSSEDFRSSLANVQHMNLPPISNELNVIPEIYFKEHFSLIDEATFTAACQMQQSEASSSLLLQEKLSHYLDIAEVELVKQISTRSDSFFAALSNLQELHEEVKRTCARINELRIELRYLDTSVVRESLTVPQLTRRRHNLLTVYKKLKLISTVSKAQPTIQLLLSNSDFAGALELISTTSEVLQEQLPGVQSFKHMHLQLKEMLVLIEKMIHSDFVKFLLEFFYEGRPPQSSDTAIADLVTDAKKLNIEPLLKHYDWPIISVDQIYSAEQLVPLMLGLLRLSKFQDSLQQYRDDLSKGLNEIVMLELETALSTKKAEGQTWQDAFSEKLNQMSAVEYIKLVNKIYTLVGFRLSKVASIHSLLSAVLSTLAATSVHNHNSSSGSYHPLSPDMERHVDNNNNQQSGSGGESSESERVAQLVAASFSQYYGNQSAPASFIANLDLEQIQKDCTDLLQSTCERAHTKCAKILKLRSEGNSRLGISDFVQLSTVTQTFISSTDKFTKKQCTSLRTAILALAKSLLDVFHSNKVSSLALTLENEDWHQVEVPSEFQDLANRLTGVTPSDRPESETENGPIAKHLIVSGQRVIVVNSSLVILKMMRDYLKFLSQLPTLNTDLLQKIIEILQLFNSRTCQLVLGAGVMHIMKNLKSITAKHLALASQALQLVVLLIPHLRASLTTYFTDKKHHILLNDLNRVLQDYLDHQQEISVKFVSILRERVVAYCRALKGIDWNSNSLSQPTAPSTVLVKEASTLHRVLSQLLPEDQVKQTFRNIASMFDGKLKENLVGFSVTTQNSKMALFNDINFLVTSMATLTDSGELGLSMEEFFRSQFNLQIPKEQSTKENS